MLERRVELVKNLGVPIAALAMMLGIAAACGGGDPEGGLLVELGESGQRRSSEEVSAEATQRASKAQLDAEVEPSPTLQDVGPAPSPTLTTEEQTSATPSAEPTPPGVTIPTGDDYDPELNMYLYLSGGGHRAEMSVQALAAAVENGDRTQVPVIIEGMRFLASNALADLSTIALAQLTGEDFGQGIAAWNDWMEWYGRNSADFPPPEGYLGWKVNLLSQIDPAFAEFLMPWALNGKIDPTEIVWGGVRKDGIPDLQNPPLLSPEEAEQAYLRAEDRVFGVSINGEHRAYPLRVVNAHEMANDVVGGEPIALAY